MIKKKKISVICNNNLSIADNGLKSSINDTVLNIVIETKKIYHLFGIRYLKFSPI